jgi:hypothetical protein
MHIGMHLVFFGKAGVTVSHWKKASTPLEQKAMLKLMDLNFKIQ